MSWCPREGWCLLGGPGRHVPLPLARTSCPVLSILGHRCQQRLPVAEFISVASVLERSWRGRLLHEVGATGAFAGSQRVWRQLCLEVGLEPMASLHLPSWSLQDFRSHFLRGRLRVPGPSSRVTVGTPAFLAPPQPVAPCNASCWGVGGVEPVGLQACV